MKAGDYFYTSWGYDQTNIDYLVIVQVSKAGKTATCRMAAPIHLGADGQQDVLTPGVAEGPQFSMRIRGANLRGSYPYCNGGRRLDTFYPVRLGSVAYQTATGFGH